jgi:hypothetical protein
MPPSLPEGKCKPPTGGRYSGDPHVFVSVDTSQHPLFVKQGKLLNLGNLYFDILSALEPKMSDFASLGIFTLVERSLQISPFMQNEPNFQKGQMNVTSFLTNDYKNWTLSERGKNEPKRTQSNPKRTQTNPIRSEPVEPISNATTYPTWKTCGLSPRNDYVYD